MALDKITETIAHFIGVFDLTNEQARLREQYEEFTALRRQAELDKLADPTKIDINSDLELKSGEYKPLPHELQEAPSEDAPIAPQVSLPDESLPPSQAPLGNEQTEVVEQQGGGDVDVQQVAIAAHASQAADPDPVDEFQGSAFTFTAQYLYLSDNDTLGQGDFRDVGEMIEQIVAAHMQAEILHAMPVPVSAIGHFLSISNVEALAEAMRAEFNTEVDGVTIHRFYGEDALGTVVNGEHVEEMPEWETLLPLFHQPDDTESTEDEVSAYPEEWDQSEDLEFETGHTVITGGNLLINETDISIGWVDAPFIALGGKLMELTMISQVAVVSDRDQGAQGQSTSGTQVVQAAQIENESNAAPWLPEDPTGDAQPTFANIDWITGDLLVANFVKQVAEATDIDHINTEISATSSYFALGDNELVNSNKIVEVGSYYDMILIGEDMISVDMVFQTLVLNDDDHSTDAPELLAAVEDEEEEAPGPSSTTAPDEGNLLMNQASLKTLGEDSKESISASLSDMLTIEDSNQEALEQALLNDPMFAGLEQLRVLKVDGSLLQVNIIEQVGILADQDDVQVIGPGKSGLHTVKSSNALLNKANITKHGVDSVVMANSDTYSDLLLHQASLIDTPETESGDELVNEAIAFLMEDDLLPEAAHNGKGFDKSIAKDMNQFDDADGMQNMLA
ncbi:hypothetical protein AVO45_05980 [Ruegeria marisrubri]|uniref:Type I secretion protein n=1 Tax=Ruegeria marisrubri TaxID=1685379 RepID=A0A0X3TY85_9RHOB|nr:hypothetical protein [Ruegeria marisrubri]KUJ80592.1 hypothetical protein AVO45_05980 [Ruegeria marisrubri]